MNINNYLPKHVNLEEAKAKAISYQGTYSELKALYEEGVVTLVTGADGDVRGIWVDSKTGDLMLDQLSGENFQRAYGCKPVMEWIDKILRGEDLPEPAPAPQYQESGELPTEVTVPVSELSAVTKQSIDSYIRAAYEHSFEKGSVDDRDYEYGQESVKVSNIRWGRKLANSEVLDNRARI